MLLLPALCCQVIMQKLSEVEQYKAAVLQYADQIMETLLRVFGNHSSSVHEEAMLAVGAFTYACGRQFSKYLQALYPFLKMGLMNHQEWQVRGGGLHSCLGLGSAVLFTHAVVPY
jgi:importin subunit beta-1